VQERDKRVPSGGRDGDATGAEKRPRKLPRRVEVPLGHGALFRMLAQFQPELADAGRGARAVGNVREGGIGKPDSVRPPLPAIDCLIDHILRNPQSQLDSPYSQIARPSIVPVRLSRTLPLQLLYSIHSERLLVKHLERSPLVRSIIGLYPKSVAWHANTLTKGRNQLFERTTADKFNARTVAMTDEACVLSGAH
jgi:hypothetical protein